MASITWLDSRLHNCNCQPERHLELTVGNHLLTSEKSISQPHFTKQDINPVADPEICYEGLKS